MTTLTRWISSLTLTPLAVLTLQGLAFNAQALTDTNAELKEAAADRATQATTVAQVRRPVQTVYVPATAKQLDRFKPVLPPERALGLAMAQAHAQSRAQAQPQPQPQTQVLAKAEAPAAAGKR